MTRFASYLTIVAFCTSGAFAEAPDDDVYTHQIKPILRARCYACHGALKQAAGLRLDTGRAIREGSENGQIISADPIDSATLLARVTATDDDQRMPPQGQPLTSSQVALLRRWILAGAQSPQNELPEEDPQQHWAFQKPQRPTLPAVTNPDWPNNPIDFFVHAHYDRQGLSPTLDATPAELLRRVFLDLTGLPPTPEQLARFTAHPTDDHYRHFVDELLASPQYGERWGRHWMDVWRYSDWYGRRQQNDVRNSAPQIWRWRDWIVNSLNDDKAYARMVQEMLAADELAPHSDDTWPATGFLIRNYYSLNPNEWMRHNVEYTAKAFLGLTFNCAHCHDHKYDPIAHEDYFRLRAIFEPLGIRQDRVVGGPDPPPFQPYSYGGSRKVVRTGMVRVYDENLSATTWFYTDGDERNKVKQRGSVPPGVPDFLGVPFEIQPIELPQSGYYPGSRPEIQAAVLADAQQELAAAMATLQATPSQAPATSPTEQDVAAAKAAFQQELNALRAAGERPTLSGDQSLHLRAMKGRRTVAQTLPGLRSVPDGTRISFQLRILHDQHINFQLTRDASKHLTALYVALTQGRIEAYRPHSFAPFQVGSYPLEEDSFSVAFVLKPTQDIAELTVQTLGETPQTLVDSVAIALNGWNPSKHPHQPLTFDCRTGTEVLVDNLSVHAGDQHLTWDFEAPTFTAGHDIDGIAGWQIHSVSHSPATSNISMIAGCKTVPQTHTQWAAAKAAHGRVSLAHTEATARVAAARHHLASLQAVIAADQAQGERAAASSEVAQTLARDARRKQQQWRATAAKHRLLQARLKLQEAEEMTGDQKQRQAAITMRQKEVEQARAAVSTTQGNDAAKSTSTEYERLSPQTSPQSTGRRAALARWITHPDNPLTARVAVNHMWMRHLHAPLVSSIDDFGRNGQPPSHPQLLDWLALELLENQWSMKHLHRLIVTSHVYRLSSTDAGSATNRKQDADNRYLWRMHAGRLEAEALRDSLLFLADQLDLQVGGQVLPNTEALTSSRRSLYYEVYPEAGGHHALAEVFDPPDPQECFRRTTTIVPQQALALSNSAFVHRVSQHLAALPGQHKHHDQQFIRELFVRILARQPTTKELMVTQQFLSQQRQVLDNEASVHESLVRVLLNHNDFVTIR